jgi:hypothetical protein
MPKANPCTLAPKHKWEWRGDKTLVDIKMTARGTTRHMRRVGVYTCACGGLRHGTPKTGL